jgi:2-polyprenyl-3-methyl-5-hydroxy-6-metoxy-1,4-benzoquinol methylase
MEIQNMPVTGGTAPRHAWRTANKLAGFALSWVGAISRNAERRRYLDVGCGNGFITELVAPDFDEVVAIDMEETRLQDFREHINGKSNFQILLMSAAKIQFPSEFFQFITSFEVLEHVPDLDASVLEMVRVCSPGGIIAVSVPHVWFPFENHGVQIGTRFYARKIPLLPYVRPLHRKYSVARVFSSAEMDRSFVSAGMKLLGTSYASPQFERAAAQANSWEGKFSFLRGLLNRCENVPGIRALTGVSMLKAYQKPGIMQALSV